MWAQLAHAGHCFAGGKWEGVVGGFECGQEFNNAAGDVFEFACVTVIVKLGYPVHVVGLSHPMLNSTSPFFDSISGLLFDLWYPLTNFFFSLVYCCGHVMHCFINDWHGGGFSGYGGHWDIDEWCGVCDGHRDFMG